MKKLIALILILFLAACGGENEAQTTAEDYMDAVKNGNEFEALEATEGFIDVFGYEYLQTLNSSEEKKTRVLSYSLWESLYGDKTDPLYPTFEEYKEAEIETQKSLDRNYEIIKDDDESLEYWDGESYYNVYEFLYNVEIANELGDKIFKKAEITVEEGLVWDESKEDYVDGYVITDIYLR